MNIPARIVSPILIGGLGNQLFQLSAALNFALRGDSKVELLLGLETKSNDTLNSYPILEFTDQNVGSKIMSAREKLLTSKILSLNLGHQLQESKIVNRAITSLTSVVLSMEYRRKMVVFSGREPGFVGFPRLDTSICPIGYFQSYRYISSDSLEVLQTNLWNLSRRERIKKWELQARKDCPIIVHIRRGDYKYEKDFGLLSAHYYKEGIEYLANLTRSEKLWIFSDEPKIAISLMSGITKLKKHFFDSNMLSTIDTLAVMSLGMGFILANSTFSYWAAMLSSADPHLIVAPTPWFASKSEPHDLVPPAWTKLRSQWR